MSADPLAGISQFYHGRRRMAGLTPLNLRTQQKFDRCAGRHTPSGDTVLREFSGRMLELPLCSRCRCPYGGPKANTWSSSRGGSAS